MTTHAWMPLYKELADKVLEYESKQLELIQIARELADADLPVGGLDDQDGQGKKIELKEIDPFSFFAIFNRYTTDENRAAILAALRKRWGLSSPVPTSFAGIPYVNNQSSWFFPYAKSRDPDDIPALWKLARQAVTSGRAGVDAAVFDRCLEIKMVGIPKLTLGLYWLAPTEFLPYDGNTKDLLGRLGFSGPITTHDEYSAFVDQVVAHLGSDFAALSVEAYSPRPIRYWAGGHQMGGEAHKDEFVAGNYWRMGWKVDTEKPDGQEAWALLRQIRPKDEFVIKGFGGRNDLVVYYVGTVSAVDLPKKTVHLQPLSRPLFSGKAPDAGPGSWFKTLRELTEPGAIDLVFSRTKSKPMLKQQQPDYPKNLILFGPPGTGKTWRVRNEIAPKFRAAEEPTVLVPVDVDDCTWFQIVGCALMDFPDGATVPQLAQHPLVVAKQESAQRSSVSATLWATLQAHAVADSATVNYAQRTEPLVFDKRKGSVWFLPHGPGPQLQEVKAGLESSPKAPAKVLTPTEWVTFHQSYGYEDFVEGIRPILQTGTDENQSLEYELRDGVFLRAVDRALRRAGYDLGIEAFCKLTSDERRNYLENAPAEAIFIDEINRGNVARIFGELISLIEPDKRLGSENELIVRLPTSGRLFGVPSNLWIIGTMNTADRSVEALDTALRRRFGFQEVAPEPALLKKIVAEDGLELDRLLATINDRLLRLRDRDHLIGHSFFQASSTMTLQQLRDVFDRNVIPLLQEYFFADYARIGMVLGKAFVRTPKVHSKLAEFDDDRREELEERRIHELVPVGELDVAAFRSIYEGG
jgi:5-methylcytosine-specific restriction protein B